MAGSEITTTHTSGYPSGVCQFVDGLGMAVPSGLSITIQSGASLIVASGGSLLLGSDELTAAELTAIGGITAGVVTASKAVIVDANKDIGDFRNLDAVNIDAGASGTAGSVDVFPGTASKGKAAITCADQTGDTEVSIVVGAMAAARTITLRDPGAAASFLTTTDATAAATTSTAVEVTRAADVSTRSVAAGGTLAVTEAAHDGRTIRLDTASGSVCTLPAPVIGMRVRFIVTVKPTSNFHQVKVAAGTDFLMGGVNILDLDAAAQGGFYANGTSDDNIQLNGTTTGGQIGDWLEFEGVSATQWAVKGQLAVPTGSNPADMFSAAV